MKFPILALSLVLALAGCNSHAADTTENVKKGILRDLAKTINVAEMELSVDSVAFRDTEADATVAFWPKGGSRAQSINMNYTMEKRGGEWFIKGRSSSHMAAAPGGSGMTGQMPAGHPAVGGEQPAGLPAGHPSLDGTTK